MAAITAAIAAASALASAGASAYSSSQQAKAAKSAAAGQQAAADQASNLQQANFETTRADLAPYKAAGYSALDELTQQLHTQPEYAAFNFGPPPDYGKLDVSLDAFTPSPDYQFTKDEALKATNSNFAARGLGQSGAALKALQDRAGQLASSNYKDWRDYTTGTYQDNRNFLQSDYQNNRNFAYQNYTDTKNFDETQRQNLLSRLYSVAGIGQNAAAGTASAGLTNAANQSNILTSNADNQGQALVAGANARATGLNSAVGALTSAATQYGSSYTAPSLTSTLHTAANAAPRAGLKTLTSQTFG